MNAFETTKLGLFFLFTVFLNKEAVFVWSCFEFLKSCLPGGSDGRLQLLVYSEKSRGEDAALGVDWCRCSARLRNVPQHPALPIVEQKDCNLRAGGVRHSERGQTVLWQRSNQRIKSGAEVHTLDPCRGTRGVLVDRVQGYFFIQHRPSTVDKLQGTQVWVTDGWIVP